MTATVAPVGAARGEGIYDGGERFSTLPGAAAAVGVPAAVVKTPITAGISDGEVDGGGSHSALVEATPMVIPAVSYHELSRYSGGKHGEDIVERYKWYHGTPRIQA